jgi:hypothetical protein
MSGQLNKGMNLRKKERPNNRKGLKSMMQELKWPLVAAIWIISMVLGYIGFSIYFSATGERFTRFDLLYRSLQLIALEFRVIDSIVPWQLQVARFLIPALAAFAAIQALLAIFSKQWQLFMVRFFKNHVVICGLDQKGLRLSREFTEFGYRVLVIEENKEICLLISARNRAQ